MRQVCKAFPFLALLVLIACHPTVRPNAINAFDSKVYDSLLIYQGVLDEAKVQFLEGKLPPNSKLIINKGGETYNLLRDAWLAYRATQSADNQAMVERLMAQMDAIILDLNKLLKKEGL